MLKSALTFVLEVIHYRGWLILSDILIERKAEGNALDPQDFTVQPPGSPHATTSKHFSTTHQTLDVCRRQVFAGNHKNTL